MNLLITGGWNHTPAELDAIRSMGHQVHLMPNEKGPLPLPYEKVEGVICNGLFLHHPIERFTALRFIQLTSAGLDRVPLDYIRRQGIALYNARGVYSIPMAEFAVAGVLQFYKQTAFFRANQSLRRWSKHRGLLELHGKTVCILGCGDVGTECAKRFRAFGCRVIGVNRTAKADPAYDEIYGMEEGKRLLPLADVIIVSLALTEQTRNYLDAAAFSAMKKGCVLVNVARGPVVDTRAMLQKLQEGTLSAVLDVFDSEPLPSESPLWDLENVIITPHNSFIGEKNSQRLFSVIKENLTNGSNNR